MTTAPGQPARVLCVVAHPDDIDYAAAGTVATLTAGGTEVSYCVVTDGQLGGFDGEIHRDRIPEIRRREQLTAAAVVGVRDVTFLGHQDGSVQVSIDLRRAITEVIRTCRPDVVIGHSPYRHFGRIHSAHPDHLATGEATLCAIYPDARNEFAYPELGVAPWTVPEVWLIGNDQPDHFVDVTDRVDLKKAALLAHVSQRAGMRGAGAELDAFLRDILGHQARLAGLDDGRLAESFRRLVTV